MSTNSSAQETPKRQVIFVGGTSYSGSTMLDMMLANGDGGFSCGEIAAAFSPYRKKHFAYADHSASDGAKLWKSIIEAGPQDLYANIFDSDPGITRIIDSSKDPIWINDQLDTLHKQGIEARSIIIWKRPSEFLVSRVKRDRKAGWQRAWSNYHKMYFRLVNNWCSVSYRDIVTDERALSRVCDRLNVPYFSGKQEYWLGSFQTLFGNDSAKIHLQDPGTGQETSGNKQNMLPDVLPSVPSDSSEKHRLIYYDAPGANSDSVDGSRINQRIMQVLTDRDANAEVSIDGPQPVIAADLKCSPGFIQAKRIKRLAVARGLSLLENVPLFRRT